MYADQGRAMTEKMAAPMTVPRLHAVQDRMSAVCNRLAEIQARTATLSERLLGAVPTAVNSGANKAESSSPPLVRRLDDLTEMLAAHAEGIASSLERLESLG